jgi:hypothetical protein
MNKTFLLFWASLIVQPVLAGAITVTDLRCEYLNNPLGIDAAKPKPNSGS